MIRVMLLCALWLSISTIPSLAHHSYALYDMRSAQSFSGEVERVEWVNPHIIISLRPDDRTNTVWRIEGHAPVLLARNGFDRTQLKVGDQIRISFHPLRQGQGGSLDSLTVSDGRTFNRFGVLQPS